MPHSDISGAVHKALSSDERFTKVTGTEQHTGALRGSYGVFIGNEHVASVGILHYGGNTVVRVIPEVPLVEQPDIGSSPLDHVEHVYRVLQAAGVIAQPYRFHRPAA